MIHTAFRLSGAGFREHEHHGLDMRGERMIQLDLMLGTEHISESVLFLSGPWHSSRRGQTRRFYVTED